MSPVPWRIVKLDDDRSLRIVVGVDRLIIAEAPPEVVPAVWTHEGCETCGGDVRVRSYEDHRVHWQPCPAPPRLVPWKGETT